MEPQSRIWTDIRYRADATAREDECGPHWIDFVVYEIFGFDGDDVPLYGRDFTKTPNEQERFLVGFIKWDGCSNWDVDPDSEAMLHFCHPNEAENVGKLFRRLYEFAAELMPGKDVAEMVENQRDV